MTATAYTAGTPEAKTATPSESATPTPRTDVQPVAHEWVNRTFVVLMTVIPILLLGVAGWQTWNSLLRWHDIVVFVTIYLITILGVTIGFHRLLTHRAFKTGPVMRGVLSIMGSVAIEGPVISWAADHRKHHAFTDEEGDPHSPHVGHGGGIRGTLHGLWHAHFGWLLLHDQRGLRTQYAPDLLGDPVVAFVHRTFFVWVAAGFVAPFALGAALGGSLGAGLTGLLWGGAVRMFVVHHLTYSINSLCHVFGRRSFDTDDESRNVAWLAVPTFGESWHNNHHAFPSSAIYALGRREVDLAGLVIRALERVGLVWDVVRVSPERLRMKAQAGGAASP
jgi:stearoyl-CoA desaturase (delta-9 desaturase)